MQIDMHYYGTYCLARAAGIKRESAKTIAYAAQFVDDNATVHVDDHDDGSKIIAVPSAHHSADIQNRDPEDQRFIWVPFHFIPGNVGTNWTEKLICRKNSRIAREMISNHCCQGHREYTLELMGIAGHVYADTFAHYGFSGVSSRRNRVNGDSFVLTQEDAVVESIVGRTFGSWINKYGGLVQNIRSRISGAAEFYSGSLGHGAVSIYPDLPFLQWQFTYEQSGETVYHDNPATYLEGAEALHELFILYAKNAPEHQDASSFIEWENIKQRVQWIFTQEGNKWDRADIWKANSEDGNFGVREKIPEYTADEWNDQAEQLKDMDEGSDGLDLEVHRFYRAADYHLHYVLRELLPANNLLVV